MDSESLFREGFNCGQAVLVPHASALGLSEEQAFKLAAGLGAGMGRMQETCGAVTGACLVLGLRYGHTAADDKARKEHTYGLIRHFHEEFATVHLSTRCSDLLGVDLRTEEGQNSFKEQELNKTVCLKCVGTADGLVRKILKENP